MVESNEYQRPPADNVEIIYGGPVPVVEAEPTPPVADLTLVRRMGQFGTLFEAVVHDETVAYCECVTDLTKGGRLPNLAGWAEVAEVGTQTHWRGKGIGTWLLTHVNIWLTLGGYTRVAICVAKDDYDNGAGRFYERFGWKELFRIRKPYTWRPRFE